MGMPEESKATSIAGAVVISCSALLLKYEITVLFCFVHLMACTRGSDASFC